ncbi:MAG: hypothetical protein HZB24_12710 [Desulfobacterales bacterium]|nr:hypothetical protein [Desulfobacterales bacterium]
MIKRLVLGVVALTLGLVFISPAAALEDKVFANKDFAQFGCDQEWAALQAEDLNDIYSYLWEFAADSPTPAKCK